MIQLSRQTIALIVVGLFAAVSSFWVTSSSQTEDTPKPVVEQQAEAIFAGGCFWCVEADFDKIEGVLETISGYTGGFLENPTYQDVVRKKTGHYEAVKVVYDPSRVTYSELVEFFWRHVDPTDAGGQFCDRGDSYRTAIFTSDDSETIIAEASKAAIDSASFLPGPIVTPILEASTFYPAETYHQNYYSKNPIRYSLYRNGCGRDNRIKEVWKNDPKSSAS